MLFLDLITLLCISLIFGPRAATAKSPVRKLSVSQFINSAPKPITKTMFYSRANESGPVACYNFSVENTGTGYEILDFDDISRYLSVHDMHTLAHVHPSIDRAFRVGQAPGYAQGPPNPGVPSADKCRIIFDLSSAPTDFDVDANLSIPVNYTTTLYQLPMLELGVLEIQGTNDASPFITQMTGMGILAEKDFPIELLSHTLRALSTESPSNDTYYGQQWSLEDMGVKQVVAERASSTEPCCESDHPYITVALIDSGVDYGHPDLAETIYENEGELAMGAEYMVDDDVNGYVDDVRGWNFVHENANVMDNNGHGTQCAGVIAAKGFNGEGIFGVGYPFARILPLKVFDYDSTGRLSDALRAVDYAIDKEVAVSTATWFTKSYSAVFHVAVDRAEAHGHLIVAAAGNDGQDIDGAGGSYPCGFNSTNVLCVAAHRMDGSRWGSSNYGPIVVDVSAPGVDVITTTSPIGYSLYNGTSASAAHVAGLAAVLIGARHPFPLRYDEVAAAIITSANATGWTAYGRVDAYAAMHAVVGDANWLNGALSVWRDEECVDDVRLAPTSSADLQLCIFAPPAIGYREYDLKGVIGEGAAEVDIRLRATPPPGLCQTSVSAIEFGDLMVGATGTFNFSITNAYGEDFVVDPARLLPWSPPLQVLSPGGPVVVSEGQSVSVQLSLEVFAPGPVSFMVDGLSPNCSALEVRASVSPSTLRISNLTADNMVDYIPVGLRHAPSGAVIENPSPYELKTKVISRQAEYMFEGAVDYVTVPLQPHGYGYIPEAYMVGQRILSNCVGGDYFNLTLGQSFPFFGVDVDTVRIACNGFIELPPFSSGPLTSPPRIPSVDQPNGVIAPYWTEAAATRCAVEVCNITYLTDYKLRVLVVEWNGLEVEAGGSWYPIMMEAQVFPNGRIDLLHVILPNPAYRKNIAVGIEGFDGKEGYNVMEHINTYGAQTLIFIPKVKSETVVVPPLSSVAVNFSLTVPYMGVADDDQDAWCQEDPNWLDADGRTCADYVAGALCTSAGLTGIGWYILWGNFMDVAATTPANVSCCGCGGGLWYRDVSPGANWQDIVKLGLEYVEGPGGDFERTVRGSQAVDVVLTGNETSISNAGGNRTLRVVALDSAGIVNGEENGLIVTVEIFEEGSSWGTKRVVLDDGEAFVEFDFPPGHTELTAVATPSEPATLDLGIVSCGGDGLVGPNNLRYLLWKPVGDSYELKCAFLSADEQSWIDPLGGVFEPQESEGWMAIMIVDQVGFVVISVEDSPRRVANVLLGFEIGGIGVGGCGGFCVFGGSVPVNFGMELRPSLIKVLREASVTSTTDGDDGRGGGSSTTTVSTITGDIITITTTTSATTEFVADCDTGCRAIRPASYCKYWLDPPVCYASDVPCRCSTTTVPPL